MFVQLSYSRHKTCVSDITCIVRLAIGLENTQKNDHRKELEKLEAKETWTHNIAGK